MKKIFLFFLLVLLGAPSLLQANPDISPDSTLSPTDNGWVTMPAGARPAYLGIHGGTMPVSLLATDDGSALLTFVGRTGNDFLQALRDAAMPVFANSTRRSQVALERLSSGLFAGNATASLPVIALSGDVLANQAWFDSLYPFGLSPQPLSIEGTVNLPDSPSAVRRYRQFFLKGSLRLRKK